MPLPKLTYFHLRGRAEPIRLMLHANGVDFDDHRIASPDEWAALKERLPFGVLPLYETDGLTIPESQAIFRHLARGFGWYGSDGERDALLDVTQEAVAEAQEDLWRFGWVRGYAEKMEPYAEHILVPRLRRLDAWFGRDGRNLDYWVADEPTHVDFLAFCYLDELDAFFPDTLQQFERLANFRNRVANLPGVAEYIASEDRPIVFGMSIIGPKIDRRRSIPTGATFLNPWTDPMPLDPATNP